MAKHATLPTDPSYSPVRQVRPARWAVVHAPATPDALTDLSAGETEARELEYSNHQARILIRLPSRSATTYLRYIENHLRGRGAFLTVENDDMLDVLYYVHENSTEAVAEVGRFACDVLRVLQLPESALLAATIKTMDDKRLKGILIAAGVERPELRLL